MNAPSSTPKHTYLQLTPDLRAKTQYARNTIDTQPQQRHSCPTQIPTRLDTTLYLHYHTHHPHNLNDCSTPRGPQCHSSRDSPTANSLRLLPLARPRCSPTQRPFHPRPLSSTQGISPATSESSPRSRSSRKETSSRSTKCAYQ